MIRAAKQFPPKCAVFHWRLSYCDYTVGFEKDSFCNVSLLLQPLPIFIPTIE